MIVIPDLYEINSDSPFFVTNKALQTTVSRLNIFYVNHHILQQSNMFKSFVLPTNYVFLNYREAEVTTPHSKKRWEQNQNYFEKVNIIEDAIETAHVIRDVALLTRSTTEVSDAFINVMKHCNYAVKKTVMPFCEIDQSLQNSTHAIKNHLDKLALWLLEIIDFFEQITNLNFLIEKISLDSFLYDEKGNLLYFIDYHKLKHASTQSKNVVEAYNIRQLAETLNTTRIWSEVFEQLQNPDVFSKNELFNRLATSEKMYSNQLTSFTDFRQFVNGRNVFQKDQKIGVFVDLAHLYIGLETYFINFDVLLTSLLGEKKKWITEMHSVQFIPNYNDENKNKRVAKWLDKFRTQLEAYGFNVKVVSNATEKAKRIVNGEEYDVDDQFLIQLMRQMRGQFSEIIVFTGDKHFFEEMILQQNTGTTVHIVTSDELATSRLLKERFKENYHSIMEFVESIEIR